MTFSAKLNCCRYPNKINSGAATNVHFKSAFAITAKCSG
jgi:hypothetical protein